MIDREHLKKIVWSIDLDSDDQSLLDHATQALRFFLTHGSAEIFPVYLMRPDKFEILGDFDLSVLKKRQQTAEDRLRKVIGDLKLPSVMLPHVLLDVTPSIGNPYELLTHYTAELNADFILVSSHAWTDISNLLFGSFAENLFQYSQTPVFVVTKKCRPITEIKKILFPTDFTVESEIAFEKNLDFAKKIESSIVLFCKEGFFNHSDLHRTHELVAKDWMSRAKQKGVHCEYFWSKSAPEDISQSIINAIDEFQCDVVAMCTHGYWWNPAGDASVARQVMRRTETPLWVFHPKEEFVRAKKMTDSDSNAVSAG